VGTRFCKKKEKRGVHEGERRGSNHLLGEIGGFIGKVEKGEEIITKNLPEKELVMSPLLVGGSENDGKGRRQKIP